MFHPLCAAFHPLCVFSAQKWPQVWDEGNPPPGILTLCMQMSESGKTLNAEGILHFYLIFSLEAF